MNKYYDLYATFLDEVVTLVKKTRKQEEKSVSL